MKKLFRKLFPKKLDILDYNPTYTCVSKVSYVVR